MFEYEIRTDSAITSTSDNIVTPQEVKKFHDFSEISSEEKITDEDVVTVAIMDTGIHRGVAKHHPWFENSKVSKTYDVTNSDDTGDAVGHGTGVASLISKNTPKVEFYSIRIFGNSGTNTGFSQVRDAYEWAIDHSDEIDIINMSWGTRSNIPELNELHEKLIDSGIYDVVSSGNSGTDGGSPATCKKAYSVGALNESGLPTRFSSFDPERGNPDIAALGKNVKMARATRESTMGTPLNNSYVKASGTSFSAPLVVSAYVNALYEKRISWDNNFMKSAENIKGTSKDGAGVLKYQESIERYKETSNTPKVEGSSWNFKGRDTLWIDADWIPAGDTTIELIEDADDYIDIRIQK